MRLAFENWIHTDHIVVTTNLNRELKIAEDIETVQAVLAFLQDHISDWTMPEDGLPVAYLRLNFYAGDEFLGNIGVDKSFLTAHQFGTFWSKPTDRAVHDRLLEILRLPPPQA